MLRMSPASITSCASAKIGKLAMKALRSLGVCFCGLDYGSVRTKRMALLSELDYRAKVSTVPRDALREIAPIPTALIENICFVRCRAQIVPFVIGAVAVPVIYLRNFLSCFHAPYDPVKSPKGTKQTDTQIARSAKWISRSFPQMFGVPLTLHHFRLEVMKRPLPPHNDPCLSVVREALAQVVL